ncbi:MAG: hypothetical protein Unbinned805contig1001_27 [Prokaryotic dsDNA virus sp.]|nr:MAG: hypothetical protein Unbinned805contig1001_27 [Prokaryotic dsDNA virus sp.]|tara:strand:+ start:199 stop:339 length:141 start_codon:yes stop_codon:yes gene_type:complete
MSNKTIPELPLVTSAELSDSDKLVIVVNGITSSVTLGELKIYINTP